MGGKRQVIRMIVSDRLLGWIALVGNASWLAGVLRLGFWCRVCCSYSVLLGEVVGLLAIFGFGRAVAGGRRCGAAVRLAAVAAGACGWLVCCGVALGAQGHAFSGVVGVRCGGEACAPGELKEPDGVAVNNAAEGAMATAGDVYVVDHALGRIERFDSQGVFQGEFAGPNASGSGSVVAGETKITGVLATSGAFTVGEEITGTGLAPGTTITALPEPGVLEVSAAATASEPAATLTASQALEHPTVIAVDSLTSEEDPSAGDVYVVDTGHAAVDKYTAQGEYITQITGFSPERPFVNPLPGIGVAVDDTGRLWIAAEHENTDRGVGVFNNATVNTLTETFFQTNTRGTQDEGFALDPSEAFYQHYNHFGGESHTVDKFAGGSGGGEVTPVRELELPVAPGGLGVEPAGSGDLYVSEGGAVERYAGAGGGLVEKFGAEHLTSGRGVAVSAANTVYVADGTAGVVDVFPLEESGPPTVESLSASNVSGDSATLEAGLNARGAEASYSFQYGRCASLAACSGAGYEPAGVGTLPADFKVRGVSVHLQGLVSSSAYHFRVLVSNALGSAPVQESTFTTQGLGSSGLLDGRRWEMVSPLEKHGALIESIGEQQVTQASVDGRAFTFLADAPTEMEPAGSADLIQVLAGRGAGGWSTSDLAGPHATPTGVAGAGQEFRWFSEDLGAAVVQPFGGFTPSLSPAASEQTAYLRSDYLGGDPTKPCVQGGASVCYTPLVAGCPPSGAACAPPVAEHANVPAGTVFGEESKCPPQGELQVCGPQFVGASPDGSHVVLHSQPPLSEGALLDSLYEWSGGQLALASVLPSGEPSGLEPVLGLLGRSARGAVSRDGSRIVWSQKASGGHLFLRDMVRGETVQLDAIQGGSEVGSPEPQFQFASSDGSRVYFTDSQPLTANSGAGVGGGALVSDLFECEMVFRQVAGKDRLACALRDLTPLLGETAAEVRGEVLGASDDGSTVYFVANGVLAAGAEPGNCSGAGSPAGAGCSLYVWHDGVTSFVARLSAEDYPDWNDRSSPVPLRKMVSRVSGDGRWLVFMSDRGLSGFDTRDAVSGKPVEEVYLFDRLRGVSVGGVGVAANPVCVSCDPGGGRPVGAVEYRFLETEGTDGTAQLWEAARLIGGSVPGWTSYSLASLYQPRFLSDSGRVFFNSPESLVAGDVNGAGDVYEFEPVGVPVGEHACSEGSSGFSVRLGGCLALVSSGQATGESGFLDASTSGSDVFFFTDAKLSRADFDRSRDVYDAHECSTAVPCLPEEATQPGACDSEESCKGSPPVQPEGFGMPASGTFTGSGNPPLPPAKKVVVTRAQRLRKALAACGHKPKRQRAACRRRAKARFAVRHAKSKGGHR